MRRTCAAVVGCALAMTLLLAGCGRVSLLQRDSGKNAEEIKFIPFRYCFDTTQSKDVRISLVFYANTRTPSIAKTSDIQHASIQVGQESLPCSVENVDVQVANEIKTQNGFFYPGSLTLRIPRMRPTRLADAQLAYSLKGGERHYRYPMGSVGVAEAKSNVGDGIDFAAVEGAGHIDGDAPVVSDLMLQCSVTKPIEIKNISLGFGDIGVDVMNLRVYSAAEYQRKIERAVRNSTLNKVIPSAYKERIADPSASDCSIKLAPGNYYLYLPLTKKASSDLDPIRVAAGIEYVVQGETKQQSYWVSSWPLFSLASWDMKTNIDALLGQDSR